MELNQCSSYTKKIGTQRLIYIFTITKLIVILELNNSVAPFHLNVRNILIFGSFRQMSLAGPFAGGGGGVRWVRTNPPLRSVNSSVISTLQND